MSFLLLLLWTMAFSKALSGWFMTWAFFSLCIPGKQFYCIISNPMLANMHTWAGVVIKYLSELDVQILPMHFAYSSRHVPSLFLLISKTAAGVLWKASDNLFNYSKWRAPLHNLSPSFLHICLLSAGQQFRNWEKKSLTKCTSSSKTQEGGMPVKRTSENSWKKWCLRQVTVLK